MKNDLLRRILVLVIVVLSSGAAGFAGLSAAAEDVGTAEGLKVTAGSKAAQDGKAADDPKGGVFTLGEIEVSDRAEKNRNITIEKVDRQEMRDYNRDDVAQAVSMLPGVTATSRGARNEKTVYIRGFDIKYVPIFLDGVPQYVPYDGYPDLARFTTFNLSEIVVSKGFTSVLYGPNTVGGAINLVTMQPQKKFEGDAGVGVASGNTSKVYANMGSKQKLWYFQAGGSYSSSDYYPLSGSFSNTLTQGSDNRNNAYTRDRMFNGKFGFTPWDGHEYVIGYSNQHGVKGVPPYTGSDPSQAAKYWQWPYWDKESVYFTTKTPLGEKSYTKVRLYYDWYNNSLNAYDNATYATMKKPSSFASWYDDHTYGGSLEAGTTIIPRNNLKMAVHYKRDFHTEHDAATYPAQNFESYTFSTGLEDTIQIAKKLYTILGVSYDYYSTVNAENFTASTWTKSNFSTSNTSAWNPQAGLFYSVTDTGKLFATAERKTRMPTIKDMYSYRLGTAIPNADLKPEKSINYQFGYQDVFWKKISVKTALFYNDITDFILQVRVPNPSSPTTKLYQNQNVGKVAQSGAEFEITGQIMKDLEGGFNYTFINRENKTNSDRLIDVPKHKIFAYGKYMLFPGFNVVSTFEYNSQRYSSADGVEVAGSFAVWNGKLMYELVKGVIIEGGVNNILDRNYALTEGYPEAGRVFFSNLRYTF